MNRLKVLIVDDEAAILALFVRAFRKEFEIATATSGPAALEILAEREFDVVVMDYSMREMNGVELAQHVARSKPDAVRVLVTAHHDLDVVRDAHARGIVADVIPKPWAPRELARVLREWCCKPLELNG